MKNSFVVLLLASATSLLLSGCHKILERWHDGDNGNNPIPQNKLCRITKIKQSYFPLPPARTGVFHYSENGNIDSVVFQDGYMYYWKYDSQNRLIAYGDTYDNDLENFVTVLHKYASSGDKIVRDTSWLVGASGFIIQVWTLEYDNKGRVVRETGIRIDDEAYGSVLPTRVYNYDKNGNLHYESFDIEYDDNINYLRTNKVFQFIQRNYSMNNPVQSVFGYNSFGLPVAQDAINSAYFLGRIPIELEYSCDAVPGNKNECRLATTKTFNNPSGYLDGTFYYTPDGKPMSFILWNEPFSSRTEIQQFYYDKHNKLTSYYINEDGANPKRYHHYGYTNGKITTDTMQSFLDEVLTQVSTLNYDNQGRVIKEEVHITERNYSPVSEYNTITYQYDGNGNLVNSLATPYDNKTSYLRTNPIWMFINRNYSRNNPKGVTSYNSNGLPLGFTNKIFGFLGWPEPTELNYSCGDKQ